MARAAGQPVAQTNGRHAGLRSGEQNPAYRPAPPFFTKHIHVLAQVINRATISLVVSFSTSFAKSLSGLEIPRPAGLPWRNLFRKVVTCADKCKLVGSGALPVGRRPRHAAGLDGHVP